MRFFSSTSKGCAKHLTIRPLFNSSHVQLEPLLQEAIVVLNLQKLKWFSVLMLDISVQLQYLVARHIYISFFLQ